MINISKRKYNINQLNSEISSNPQKFIADAEKNYYSQIESVAKTIIKEIDNGPAPFILLSGPSGSTKTTTSEKITDELKKSNINSVFISLDNFFIDNHKLPTLPNGDKDYESVKTLDMPTLHRCLHELIVKRESVLPIFDFPNGKRSTSKTQKVSLDGDTAVIIEGIHAINPSLTMNEDDNKFMKIFVSPNTAYCDDNDEVILQPRVLRLIRRLVRDFFYRGNSLENTLKMWVNVVNSESENILPYSKNADLIIDTSILYEPCIFNGYLNEVLPKCKVMEDKYQAQIDDILSILNKFTPLSREFIPANTVIHEFIK